MLTDTKSASEQARKPNKRPVVSALQNVLLFACSLFLFFGVAEVVTRLTWKQPVHDLYQVLPDQAHMIPNSEGFYKTSEFEFTVKTNRFGHRDWEWTDSVISDPCGIVFVGDSFIFGYGVNDADTVPTLLEKELQKKGKKLEVFNFGVGGGFPEYRIVTREAIEMGVQAKTILVGVFLGNDFDPEAVVHSHAGGANSTSHRRGAAPHLADSAFYRFLKVRVSSSPLSTGLLFKMGNWLHWNIYPTSNGYIFLRHWTKDQEALFYSFLNQSLDIAKLARENGRDVVFVLLPNKAQVENSADLTSSVYDATLPDTRILDFCGKHGLRCLDLLPTLRSAYARDHRPLFFPVDRHMNAHGNQVAASAVAEYLHSQTLLCPN